MAATSIVFSGAGTLRNPVNEGVFNTSIRSIWEVTVVNSETLTLNHMTDLLKIRNVRVLNATTGAEAAVDAAGIVSVTKTDADTTTIVFGASAAGNWNIVIDN